MLIIQLLKQGLSSAEIAGKVGVSPPLFLSCQYVPYSFFRRSDRIGNFSTPLLTLEKGFNSMSYDFNADEIFEMAQQKLGKIRLEDIIKEEMDHIRLIGKKLSAAKS